MCWIASACGQAGGSDIGSHVGTAHAPGGKTQSTPEDPSSHDEDVNNDDGGSSDPGPPLGPKVVGPKLKPAPIPKDDPQPAGSQLSSLWGVSGEAWTAAGRLPDFSYAGYRAAEA